MNLIKEDCWVIESRKIFPVTTNWDFLYTYSGTYFKTEDAIAAIERYIAKYEKNAQKVIKDFHVQVEEIPL